MLYDLFDHIPYFSSSIKNVFNDQCMRSMEELNKTKIQKYKKEKTNRGDTSFDGYKSIIETIGL